MSSQTGLHYNQPCADSIECLSFVAPPVREIPLERQTEDEQKMARYCTPCREAGCWKEGKHVSTSTREDSV